MGSTTPNRLYRYPVSTDTPNIPGDMQNLAVDIDTDINTIVGNLFGVSDTSPTTVTATVATDIAGFTIPANEVVAGATYELNAYGNGVNASTSRLLVFGMAIGGAANGNPQGPAATAWDLSIIFRWQATARIVFLTSGAGGTAIGNCSGIISVTPGPNLVPANTTDATIPFSSGAASSVGVDTTADQVFSIQAKWGGTGATVTCTACYMKKIV